MLSVRIQKFGSLLGLLAILLSVLAPTVSWELAARDHLIAFVDISYCTANPADDAPGRDDKPAHPAMPHDGQACAYCGLLVHMPALPGGTATFTAERFVARTWTPMAPRGILAEFPHTAAQPRAPPVFS